jgi:hypothetical protein
MTISLQGVQFPLVLSWSVHSDEARHLVLRESQAGGGGHILQGNGKIQIVDESTSSLVISQGLHESVPQAYRLGQNFPDPFNPATVIGYSLVDNSSVRLSVFDMLGREVATLVNEREEPGDYSSRWDAREMPSGVYIYRLTTVPISGTGKAFVSSRKMVLTK